jgi:hypothetical protein
MYWKLTNKILINLLQIRNYPLKSGTENLYTRIRWKMSETQTKIKISLLELLKKVKLSVISFMKFLKWAHLINIIVLLSIPVKKFKYIHVLSECSTSQLIRKELYKFRISTLLMMGWITLTNMDSLRTKQVKYRRMIMVES